MALQEGAVVGFGLSHDNRDYDSAGDIHKIQQFREHFPHTRSFQCSLV